MKFLILFCFLSQIPAIAQTVSEQDEANLKQAQEQAYAQERAKAYAKEQYGIAAKYNPILRRHGLPSISGPVKVLTSDYSDNASKYEFVLSDGEVCSLHPSGTTYYNPPGVEVSVLCEMNGSLTTRFTDVAWDHEVGGSHSRLRRHSNN